MTLVDEIKVVIAADFKNYYNSQSRHNMKTFLPQKKFDKYILKIKAVIFKGQSIFKTTYFFFPMSHYYNSTVHRTTVKAAVTFIHCYPNLWFKILSFICVHFFEIQPNNEKKSNECQNWTWCQIRVFDWRGIQIKDGFAIGQMHYSLGGENFPCISYQSPLASMKCSRMSRM